MAGKVSFKVYLQDPSMEEGVEVRRFIVDKVVSTSLFHIREKLVSIFPTLAEYDFSISWKDEEGDNITVNTDNELILAMAELAGPVYKLTATVRGSRKSHQQQDKEAAAGASTTHTGVTCDSCDKTPIVGLRYKCVVCRDYDLCSICNDAGKHPGHKMMKISGPEVVWPQSLFQRMNKMQEKAGHKIRSGQEKMGDCVDKASGAEGSTPPQQLFDFQFKLRSECKELGMFSGCGMGGVGGRGRRGGCGLGGGWGGMNPSGGAQCGSWAFPEGGCGTWAGPAFEAMMKAWMGGDQTGQQSSKTRDGVEPSARAQEAQATAAAAHQFAHSAAQAAAQGIHTAAHAAAQAAKAAEEAFAKAGMSPVRSGQEYLQKVVVDTLDPLGKYMEVDEETPGGQRTNPSSSISATVAKDRETQEKEERSASPSDDEGWTVLTDKKPEAGEGIKIPLPTVYSPLLTPAETSTAVETNANVTNNAPTTTDPFGPSATAQTVQPEPRIQVALKAMMNMGFSNEGNWLANLIEVKDGDITKVLDILQVVKK